jgi:hypothetical protein
MTIQVVLPQSCNRGLLAAKWNTGKPMISWLFSIEIRWNRLADDG